MLKTEYLNLSRYNVSVKRVLDVGCVIVQFDEELTINLLAFLVHPTQVTFTFLIFNIS